MYRYKKIKLKDGTTIDEHRLKANAKDKGYNTVVHHIDGNKLNNDPLNLCLMTRSEHCKLHCFGTTIRPSPLVAPDHNNTAICRQCNRKLPWESFATNIHASHGKRSLCKECWNLNNKKWRNKKEKVALW